MYDERQFVFADFRGALSGDPDTSHAAPTAATIAA